MSAITVRFVEGADTAYVSGYRSRDLILRAGGRRPLWSRPRHGWATSRKVGIDLVAMAEDAGFDVLVADVERGGRR